MKRWILATSALLAATGAMSGESRLKPCPDSPNCVSSLADDDRHYIRPLVLPGDDASAWRRLQSVLAGMPRVTMVTATETYLHAEFSSALFRFVDDVEFELDAENGRIDVRSASRVGHSDLGANRRRVETIRRAFGATAANPGKERLVQYRWKSRILLLFAPDSGDAELAHFQRQLADDRVGLKERDLVVLEQVEAGALRDDFAVPGPGFHVLLIGKDGGEKLRLSGRISLADIFTVVDSMPMRLEEMRSQQAEL